MTRRLLLLLVVLLAPAVSADQVCSTSIMSTGGCGGSGGGTVTGPAAACDDNDIARWDGATTTVLQCSAATLSDAGVITAAGVNVTGLTASRLVVTDGSKNLASNAAMTTDTIPKAASSGASLANSTITDDGTTVTINTGTTVTTSTATSTNLVGSTGACGGGASTAANSVCLTANARTSEGTTADAFESVLAFGDHTGDQTLTETAATSTLGFVVTAPAAPANGTTVGNSLAWTASAATPNAGAGTDGAAAGGGITFTTGAAARDTSGNANGGDFTITTGAGIGTGIQGRVIVGDGTSTQPVLTGSDSDTGLNFAAGTIRLVANGVAGLTQTNTTTTVAGAINMSGTLLGAQHSTETVATSKTPSAAESNELYTNGSDVDGLTITLLDNPTVGVCYLFAVVTAVTSNSFAIVANTGETLRDGGTACGTSFAATALGSTARICAVSGGSGGQWFVMSKNGSWTCSLVIPWPLIPLIERLLRRRRRQSLRELMQMDLVAGAAK